MRHYFRFLAFLCILSSPAMANGLLIYKEQGFHSDQQAKIEEYLTVEIIPQVVTVTLKTGSKLDVPAGKSPIVIPFVNESLEEPDSVITRIESAIARFPQYKTRLEKAKSEWSSKKQKVTEQKAKNNNLPGNSESAETESSKVIKFRDGVVTSVYPDGIMLSTESGVSKIYFSTLSAEEKKFLGYDAEKEKQYFQQQKAARDAILKEEEERQLQTRDVQYNNLYADDLTKAYDDNEVDANRQYKGAKVRIIGVIDHIGEDIMGTPYVSLKGHKMFSYVQCMFVAGQSKKLSYLRKKDEVVIFGIVSGNLMGPILRECTLQ